MINGNNFHKIYQNFNNGEAILLECFDDKPELKNKHLQIWQVLSKKCHKLIGTSNATNSQLEELAETAEKLTILYPVLFPDQNITRKQHCISLVLPEIIRREKNIYKYLKMEQEGERIHKRLNDFKRKLNNRGNKEKMLMQMIELIELQNDVDITKKAPKKRQFRNKSKK